MNGSRGLGGVILAAGASQRMGRDKALLPWPPGNASGRTFLSETIESLKPHTELVIVVGGGNAGNLTPLVDAGGASLVVNPVPAHGQFSSLQIGLRELLYRDCDAALITLVDRPPLNSRSVAQLCQAYFEAVKLDLWAIIPEHEGQQGHPIVVGRELIEAFLQASIHSNAREVMRAQAGRLRFLSVPDAAAFANINTPEDYERLISQRR